MNEVNRAYVFKQQCEKNDTALRESISKVEIDDSFEYKLNGDSEGIDSFGGNTEVDIVENEPVNTGKNRKKKNVTSG